MGWTSTNIKVEMMNEQAAINAAEAIKNYAFANAERFSSMNADTLADSKRGIRDCSQHFQTIMVIGELL